VTPSDAIAGATKNVNASSFRLRVTMTEVPNSGASGATTIVGDGQLDYGASRGHMQYDFSQSTGAKELAKVDLVFDGPNPVHPRPRRPGIPQGDAVGTVEMADLQRLEGSTNVTLAFFSELGSTTRRRR
jgi:hypothetical protein